MNLSKLQSHGSAVVSHEGAGSQSSAARGCGGRLHAPSGASTEQQGLGGCSCDSGLSSSSRGLDGCLQEGPSTRGLMSVAPPSPLWLAAALAASCAACKPSLQCT